MTALGWQRERDSIRRALIGSRRFILTALEHGMSPLATAVACELLQDVHRAIGATLTKSDFHDAGAYAQCSWCHRYSADPSIPAGQHTPEPSYTPPVCDCGRSDGWTCSFLPPGPAATWALGVKKQNGGET